MLYFSKGILQRKINLQESIPIVFALPLGVHPDYAVFNYQIVMDFDVVSSGRFAYPKFRLHLQDIIATLSEDKTAYLELSIYLNGDTYPRMSRFPLTFNAPPKGGKFIVTPKSGTSLSTTFTFMASNWHDNDNPIKYRYLLYLD